MKPKRAAGALLARAQALPAAHRRTRTLLAAAAAFACNLLYALYNGALGVAGGSPWFLAMCAFYGILAAMRFSAVLCGYRGGRAARADREYFVMALVGALLALLYKYYLEMPDGRYDAQKPLGGDASQEDVKTLIGGLNGEYTFDAINRSVVAQTSDSVSGSTCFETFLSSLLYACSVQ